MWNISDKVAPHALQAPQVGQVLDGNNKIVIALSCRFVALLRLRFIGPVPQGNDRDFPGKTGFSLIILPALRASCVYALLHELYDRCIMYNLVQLEVLQWICRLKQVGSVLVVVADG